MRLALVSIVLSIAALAATASPAVAGYYHGCSVGSGRGYGVTYLTSLGVHRVSCDKGKSVVRAFNRCRKGATGRCHHRVLHFSCGETRGFGHGQFTSKVVCKHSAQRVRFTYTQFT